jgi:hypothetical protein
VTEALHRRAREIRARAAVRAWEYRQRHHAKGVWFRLRRVLAEAREAWAIPPDEADRLVAEGYVPEAVGSELAPPKRILFVPEARLATISARRRLRVGLGADLLGAPCVVLVRFPP